MKVIINNKSELDLYVVFHAMKKIYEKQIETDRVFYDYRINDVLYTFVKRVNKSSVLFTVYKSPDQS